MSDLTHVKLGLVAVGVVLFGYGVRFEHPVARWVGIGSFALAFLVRLMRRRRPDA